MGPYRALHQDPWIVRSELEPVSILRARGGGGRGRSAGRCFGARPCGPRPACRGADEFCVAGMSYSLRMGNPRLRKEGPCTWPL
jgi:hypothetical protein